MKALSSFEIIFTASVWLSTLPFLISPNAYAEQAFHIVEGKNFAWASGSRAYLVDKNVTAAALWEWKNVPNGVYEVFLGNYRDGRTLHASLNGIQFYTMFEGFGKVERSSISQGVEERLGWVKVRGSRLRLWLFHRAGEGRSRFGSYFDYMRLVDGAGCAKVYEAEEVKPVRIQDTNKFDIKPAQTSEDVLKQLPDDSAVRVVAARIHSVLWTKFVHSGTDMLYTRLEGWLPEDCSLYGGFYLACLLDREECQSSKNGRAEIERIVNGLLRNAKVSGISGHLARGIWPDGRWVGDPSVDQYTGWIYGLWRFARSPLASPEQKGKIANLLDAMLRRLEKNRFVILRADNATPTKFGGDLPSLVPTRAERLLAFLLAGYDLTHDKHWLEVYHQLREQRLDCIRKPKGQSWVLLQNAVALNLLKTVETDGAVLEVYREAARNTALACIPQIDGFMTIPSVSRSDHEFLDRLYADGLPLNALRIPIEAVTTVLISGEKDLIQKIAPKARALLVHYDYDRLEKSPSLVSAEWNYWLGVKMGLYDKLKHSR